jgi:cytochrome c-type biogenesis protein
MIEGITLAFAVGLFAVVSPSAIGFAVALIGLPVRAGPERGSPIRTATAMGLCFALVFAIAGLAVSAGLGKMLDVIPWIAAAAGIALAATGIRAVVAGAGPNRAVPATAFGTVFAIAALPSILSVFNSIVDQGVEASGVGAAVGVTVAFGAGCAAALTLLALAAAGIAAASAKHAPLGSVVARAAGALVAAAGIWIVAYWLPALFGGRIERGGAVESAANALSATVTAAAARYELAFALVLLAMSVTALAAAARPRPG